jgi:hypothetical protein
MCSHACAVAENTCPKDATYTLRGGGDVLVTLSRLAGTKMTDIGAVVNNPFQLSVANNMPHINDFECVSRNIPSSNSENIPTSRNILRNVVDNPTWNMSNDTSTKFPFGNSSKRTSNSVQPEKFQLIHQLICQHVLQVII